MNELRHVGLDVRDFVVVDFVVKLGADVFDDAPPDVDFQPGVDRVVIAGNVAVGLVVNFVAEREFPPEQHRLFERLDDRRGARPDLHAEAEFLPAAAELVARVEQIEIALLKFREAGNAFDRGEARAERERSRAAFPHGNAQIFLRGDAGVDRLHRHVVEVARAADAALRRLHAHGVENFARRKREFPQDDFRLGNVVPVDRNRAQVGLLVFRDVEDDVDRSRLRVRFAGNGDARVEVADFAVILADFRRGDAHGFGRIPVAGNEHVELRFFLTARAARRHFREHREDARFREAAVRFAELVPGNFDVPDRVAPAFVDDDFNRQVAERFLVVDFGIADPQFRLRRRQDFDVEEAFVLVEHLQRVHVGVEFLPVEIAAAREPRKFEDAVGKIAEIKPPGPGRRFEQRAQLLRGKRFVPDEIHGRDARLEVFPDAENDVGRSRLGVAADFIGNFRERIVFAAVFFPDFPNGALDGGFVKRRAGDEPRAHALFGEAGKKPRRRGIFLERGVLFPRVVKRGDPAAHVPAQVSAFFGKDAPAGDRAVPGKNHVGENRPRREQDVHVHRVRVRVQRRFDADVVEKPGRVKRADGFGNVQRRERLAFAQRHVRGDDVRADFPRAVDFVGDFADDGRFRRAAGGGSVRRLRGERRSREKARRREKERSREGF